MAHKPGRLPSKMAGLAQSPSCEGGRLGGRGAHERRVQDHGIADAHTEPQRELAAEQWVGHNDGYALNTNNYRVYFNPADGKAQIVPWDFDYGFLHDSDWGMSWASPLGRLAKGCFLDPQCSADHKAAVKALLDAIDPAALLAWFNQIDALTYADSQSDPRRECGPEGVAPSRDALRAYLTGENAALAAFWGL